MSILNPLYYKFKYNGSIIRMTINFFAIYQ